LTAAVSQFNNFSAVRIFRWLQFLKLGGYRAVQQNFHWEREGAADATGGGTTMATRMGRVEALQAGGCGVGERLTF